MIQEGDKWQKCLVCQAPVSTLHLGMDVCRACSSFFKRTVTMGLQYQCRQGNYTCSVAKDGKFMCRCCRFNRCLLVGLEYEGPTKIRTLPIVPHLQKVGNEFRALIERRRTRELKILRNCAIRIPHPIQELYYVHVPVSVEVYTIAVVEAVTFYENAFPTLKLLERQEWEIIFKDFVAKLNLISSYYCGRKLWGDCRTKVMCTTVTCYDIEVPFDFYYPAATENKGAFKSSLRTHADDHIAIFLPIFNRAKITETEFHALSALIMTDHGLPISDKAQQLIDDIRRRIFDDLHVYYQNKLGLKDYSIRLGNLMTLNHVVQECCAIFNTFFQLYSTIFETHMVDREMEQLLLGS